MLLQTALSSTVQYSFHRILTLSYCETPLGLAVILTLVSQRDERSCPA